MVIILHGNYHLPLPVCSLSYMRSALCLPHTSAKGPYCNVTKIVVK